MGLFHPLERRQQVIEVFAPAGQTDLLCRVVAKDPEDLYRVSEEIRLCPGILRTSTSMFLRTVIPYRVAPLLAGDEVLGRGGVSSGRPRP